jgi:cytochrome c-type biogenesis protein CcmH/NrfF
MIDLDGAIIDPDREVNAQLARLVTVDPDSDVEAWLLWTAGETGVEMLRALLLELKRLRQETRRRTQSNELDSLRGTP